MNKKRVTAIIISFALAFSCCTVQTTTVNAGSFKWLVKYMKSKKVLKGKKVFKLASMIGAKKGVSYGSIELYEFKKGSKALKKVKASKKITLKSLNMKCKVSAINGTYVLLFSQGAAKNKKAIKYFKMYK